MYCEGHPLNLSTLTLQRHRHLLPIDFHTNANDKANDNVKDNVKDKAYNVNDNDNVNDNVDDNDNVID